MISHNMTFPCANFLYELYFHTVAQGSVLWSIVSGRTPLHARIPRLSLAS